MSAIADMAKLALNLRNKRMDNGCVIFFALFLGKDRVEVNMWYVLQTMTGDEEELVHMIRRLLPSRCYTDCFVPYYERVWRKQQKSYVHVERLFPGYVFILTDTPDDVFMELKRVPAMSKLLADGNFNFLSLEAEEEEFFCRMLGETHIVRLSYVETNGKGKVYRVSGPLEEYLTQVVRYQFKKRYAIIRLKLLGEEKTTALGIILNEDVRQEIEYGKIEAPVTLPPTYQAILPEAGASFDVGDQVTVLSGTFEHMSGIIWKVKKNTVEIGVRLFGQDMSMEVPVELVCKS